MYCMYIIIRVFQPRTTNGNRTPHDLQFYNFHTGFVHIMNIRNFGVMRTTNNFMRNFKVVLDLVSNNTIFNTNDTSARTCNSKHLQYEDIVDVLVPVLINSLVSYE